MSENKSKQSLNDLVSSLKDKSATPGGDAVVAYDRTKTNKILNQQYIDRFNADNSSVPPVPQNTEEALSSLVLDEPRLSFGEENVKNPSLDKADLKLDKADNFSVPSNTDAPGRGEGGGEGN